MKKRLILIVTILIMFSSFNLTYANSKNNINYHSDGKHMNVKQVMIISISKSRKIILPAVFVSNGASIPSWLNWLFPRHGKYDLAAIVHDYLYVGNGMIWEDNETANSLWGFSRYRPTRKESDLIFLELMERDSVSYKTRYAMYSAVRTFGNSPFINAKDRWIP